MAQARTLIGYPAPTLSLTTTTGGKLHLGAPNPAGATTRPADAAEHSDPLGQGHLAPGNIPARREKAVPRVSPQAASPAAENAEAAPMKAGHAAATPDDTPTRPGLATAKSGGKPTKPGRITAILFWTDVCEHCYRHLPAFQRVADRYAGKPVDFLTVCSGEKDAARAAAAAKDRGLTLPVALDPHETASGRYGVRVFPVVFVLAADGAVQAVHGRTGVVPGSDGLQNLEADLRAQLDLLLALDTPSGRRPLTEPGHPASPARQGPAGKTRADFPAPGPQIGE